MPNLKDMVEHFCCGTGDRVVALKIGSQRFKDLLPIPQFDRDKMLHPSRLNELTINLKHLTVLPEISVLTDHHVLFVTQDTEGRVKLTAVER